MTSRQRLCSSSTLIGPFEPSHALTTKPLARRLSQAIRKAEEAKFKPNCSFFTGLSTAEAHACGVKFIGLYGTVGFIAIREFSFPGEGNLWSDIWPAIDGLVCLSLLLEGETTISNNFNKRRQNDLKIGTRNKFTTHLRQVKWENFISNKAVICSIFLRPVTFPYNSLYIQAVPYATYAMQSRIVSLGSLW